MGQKSGHLSDFYPRPPRGGRPGICIFCLFPRYFYPRPPRGGRLFTAFRNTGLSGFLSTPSARRATHPAPSGKPVLQISIHALREEGDASSRWTARPSSNFYPRPPRGGRLPAVDLSRPKRGISIHALREEGDEPLGENLRPGRDFYPRPPRGGRPDGERRKARDRPISIHALREEGDARGHHHGCVGKAFLSTPSARRATSCSRTASGRARYFYPRPPRGGRLERGDDFRPGELISIHALREEGDHRHSENAIGGF